MMSNKEAIEDIKHSIKFGFCIHRETAEMAIKALEQESIPDDCEILTKEAYSDLCLRAAKAEQEECEDCISREQALIDIVNNTHLDGYDLSEALNVIENMPSVKPKRDDAKDDLK